MSEAESPTPPAVIRGSNLTARILRERIWKAANVENDWFCFVIVGREGSGKSKTAASIMEHVDPTFGAENTHFNPVDFLDDINADDADKTGKAVLQDEAGVGLGNRTWYDRGQIELNQALQTARDDNMIVGLTLPRLEELDIQVQGRLHALIQMDGMEKGEYSRFRFQFLSPSRDGRDKLYRYNPRRYQNGRQNKVKTLAIGPPSTEFDEAYEAKKSEFKDEFYESTRETLEEEHGEDEEELTPKEIAEKIVDAGRVEEFVGDNYGQQYIDKDKIANEYDLGNNTAKRVKKALMPEVGDDVI